MRSFTIPPISYGFVLAAGLLSSPGCYRTHLVAPSELSTLAGYDTHTLGVPRRLTDARGTSIAFEPQSRLYLVQDQNIRRGGRFSRLEITDSILWGRLNSGTEVMIPLPSVRYAEVQIFSKGRTAGLILGVVLGAGALSAALTVPLVGRGAAAK